jgi:hypothetical protein
MPTSCRKSGIGPLVQQRLNSEVPSYKRSINVRFCTNTERGTISDTADRNESAIIAFNGSLRSLTQKRAAPVTDPVLVSAPANKAPVAHIRAEARVIPWHRCCVERGEQGFPALFLLSAWPFPGGQPPRIF